MTEVKSGVKLWCLILMAPVLGNCSQVEGDADVDFDDGGDTDSESGGDSDSDSDGDGDADGDSDGDGDSDSDGDGDADSDVDGDADSDADGDSDSDTDGDADADGDADTDDGVPYIHDNVHLLVYRFDFPDAELEWTEDAIRSDLDDVHQYYQEQSYGRFSVTYEIHPEIFTGDNPLADYDDWYSFVDLYKESIAGTGVDPEFPGYTTRIIVTSPQIGNFNSSGGPPLMTIFHYSAGTVAHELGHVLGLHHARAIEAGDQIIGIGDYETESLDYGNVYCMMGMGASGLEEYNLLYKDYFAWLEPGEVTEVTSSGTYRIYAFDQGKIGGDSIGLNIESGNGEYTYWVEYRIRGPYDSKQGVLLNLQGYFDGEGNTDPSYWQTTSHLLDMTPESQTTDDWWAEDQTDSELLIGETYTDHWDGFSITPVKTSEQTEDETAWIEVDVEML